MMRTSSFLVLIFTGFFAFSQNDANRFDFDFYQDYNVINGDTLEHPWAGGLNYTTINSFDFNQDGDMDLFLYDRIGRRILPFISVTNAGVKGYSLDLSYVKYFPDIEDWILIRDFNCDSKLDLFIGAASGIVVYENTTTGSDFTFSKAHQSNTLQSFYSSGKSGIYVVGSDIPAIDDIDGDGDLDILTFEINGSKVEFHENQSSCGLDFSLESACWGYFTEEGTNNKVVLDQCLSAKKGGVHAGSTLLTLDLDNDQLKDLLLGDISFKTVVALSNKGSLDSARIVSQDTTFPSYDTPVNIDLFPAMSYEDVDFDGVKDLLVTPNEANTGSINFKSIWYYKNIGATNQPNFRFTSDEFLQGDMIDLGEGAFPRIVDLNGDSLQDLVIANGGYFLSPGVYATSFAYLENVGSSTEPVFNMVDSNYLNISQYNLGRNVIPTFGDLDGDGDFDMIIGDIKGQLHFFTNTGSTTNPSFSLSIPGINSIDVGNEAAPYLFDLDKDGDLDLLVGTERGKVQYFNNSSASSPNFTLVTSDFGGINVKTPTASYGYAIPVVFEEDSILSIIVGSEDIGFVQYDSIESALNAPLITDVTLGSGNLVSSGDEETPFGVSKRTGRNQILYTAKELLDAGLDFGYIESIFFEINNSGNPIIQNGFNIRMKLIEDTVLTSWITGTEEVASELRAGFGSGWNRIDLEDRFLYDGKSSLLIEICFSQNLPGSDIRVKMHTTSTNKHAYGDITNWNTIQANGCNMPFDLAISKRPNMRLRMIPAVQTKDNFSVQGYRIAPDFADLDNDGYIDAIYGNFSGGVTFMKGKKYVNTINIGEFAETIVQKLIVFPNPNNGRFKVQLETNQDAIIEIYDLSGKLIFSQHRFDKTPIINLESVSDGIYIIKAQQDGNIYQSKIIVQNQ